MALATIARAKWVGDQCLARGAWGRRSLIEAQGNTSLSGSSVRCTALLGAIWGNCTKLNRAWRFDHARTDRLNDSIGEKRTTRLTPSRQIGTALAAVLHSAWTNSPCSSLSRRTTRSTGCRWQAWAGCPSACLQRPAMREGSNPPPRRDDRPQGLHSGPRQPDGE